MMETSDYRGLSSATLHEAAGQIGNLPSMIKPLHSRFKLIGKAFPVLSPPRDNLWLHRAIYEAQAGDVLVVDVGGFYEAGYWGEIMTIAAQQQNIAGLVIDGCVRDYEQILHLNFPVFSRGLCIRGTAKNKSAYGAVNEPIRIGETVVFPGDLVVGDCDGVVVIPKEKTEKAIKLAEEREGFEQNIIQELTSGKRTIDLFNL